VTGLAADPHFAFEKLIVDSPDDLDHVARSRLLAFVVLVERELAVLLHVTVAAAESRRGFDEVHRGLDLIRRDVFQRLDVLVFLAGQLTVRSWRGLLRPQSNRKPYASRTYEKGE
jgi:hypothetical protein